MSPKAPDLRAGPSRPSSLQEVDGGCLPDEPLSQGRVGLQGGPLQQKAPAETDTVCGGTCWRDVGADGRTQAAWAGGVQDALLFPGCWRGKSTMAEGTGWIAAGRQEA